MAKKTKETKVIYRKLGKEKAIGLAHIGKNKIEIDERLGGYKHALVLLHEQTHIMFPDWSESKVEAVSRQYALFLWQNNFRWVDLAKK